jgi:L-alanine-DL-glutamate epimerase-like enolase superfamily enzyme
MKIFWKRTQLKLKETFSIAHGNFDVRNALLVTLSHDGKSGFGECVEITYYGISLDDFEKKLQEIQPILEIEEIIYPKDFFKIIENLNLHSFLLSALDCAYWDLYGKIQNKSFVELENISTEKLPDSSFTISISPIEEQILKIEKSSWHNFKVKCKDLNINNVQKLLQTGKKIALDANASFTNEDCKLLENSGFGANLLYVEQPLAIGNFSELNCKSNVKWLADEDCQDISSLQKLKPHYAAINVKLMKCGGITPALALIMEAKKLGFQVMIGCMTESTVGISAGIAIASLCDFADLDGANLISNDFASGSFVEKGNLHLSEKAGLGISLK